MSIKPVSLSETLTLIGISVVFSVLFFSPLWLGCGLIGGDTNTYSLPLKAFYASQLQQGELALWNNLWGHGFPALAESQTAVLYPPNLLMYAFLPLNDAYVLSQVLHYVFGFSGMWLLARRLGLTPLASCLCSLIVIYGWFPPRISLDWAIITGAWLPWIAWSVLGQLNNPTAKQTVLTAVLITCQLLAGHFNLAFLTLLLIGMMTAVILLTDRTRTRQKLCSAGLSVVLGFLLAGVQLIPTWELKANSQRSSAKSESYSASYGHLPPLYLSQLAMPWKWYSSPTTLDDRLNSMPYSVQNAATNKVEAHFYFGLTGLCLLCAGVIVRLTGQNRRHVSESLLADGFWIGLVVFSVWYATGFLVSSLGRLPGFSFFTGPGRYTLLATLAIAILIGRSFDLLTASCSKWLRVSAGCLVLLLLTCEFWIVSGLIRDAFPTADPPIVYQQDSLLWQLAQESSIPPRIYAPGPNLVTLVGVSQTPVYLGLGPQEYYNNRLKLPEKAESLEQGTLEWEQAYRDRLAWLQQVGVTHLLLFEPLTLTQAPIQLLWEGFDPVLNRAWGRNEPVYIYQLLNTRGPVFSTDPDSTFIEVVSHTPAGCELKVNCSNEVTIVLTELMFPGWKVTVDCNAAEAIRFEDRFKAVRVAKGAHTIRWSYQPVSFWWGLSLSSVGVLGCIATLLLLRERPREP